MNILPLFTEIEKNNCFSICTGSDLNNIFRRKPLIIDSETLAKREFTPDVTKTGDGEWGMGNGEWGMGNGEWGMENEEWGMGNGEWGMGNGK